MLGMQTLNVQVITRAPDLNDVLQAEGGSITLPVTTFEALTGEGLAEASCKPGELTLRNVRNIKLDSADRQFSFEGDCQYSYEHSSYNQSSTRTETTRYRVIIRWTYNRQEYTEAHLLLLW